MLRHKYSNCVVYFSSINAVRFIIPFNMDVHPLQSALAMKSIKMQFLPSIYRDWGVSRFKMFPHSKNFGQNQKFPLQKKISNFEQKISNFEQKILNFFKKIPESQIKYHLSTIQHKFFQFSKRNKGAGNWLLIENNSKDEASHLWLFYLHFLVVIVSTFNRSSFIYEAHFYVYNKYFMAIYFLWKQKKGSSRLLQLLQCHYDFQNVDI